MFLSEDIAVVLFPYKELLLSIMYKEIVFALN